jgi:dTDP-4-dehydrorhamnose reductase
MDCGKATRHGVIFSNVLDGLKRCVDDYRLRRCTD